MNFYSQFSEDKLLFDEYLNYRDGFFIEIGDMDGIMFSNTKFFEDEMDWNGILIEPDRHQYDRLVNNIPNCYNFNYVVSETTGFVDFIGNQAVGGILSTMDEKHKEQFNLYPEDGFPILQMESLPFHEITKNVDIEKVDFLSIDVEGGGGV